MVWHHAPKPPRVEVDGVGKGEPAACPAGAANVALLGEDVGRWPTDKRVAALAMVVHCADLGNPGKPLPFSLNWCAFAAP